MVWGMEAEMSSVWGIIEIFKYLFDYLFYSSWYDMQLRKTMGLNILESPVER